MKTKQRETEQEQNQHLLVESVVEILEKSKMIAFLSLPPLTLTQMDLKPVEHGYGFIPLATLGACFKRSTRFGWIRVSLKTANSRVNRVVQRI